MKVGSKVKRIREFQWLDKMRLLMMMGYIFPDMKSTYTVREIIDCPDGSIGILLEEIVNPRTETTEWGVVEICWPAEYFAELLPPMDVDAVIEKALKNTEVHEEELVCI